MHIVRCGKSKPEVERSHGAAGSSKTVSAWHRLISALVAMVGGTWSNQPARAMRRLQLVETLSLGPKKQLLLIRCEDEKYLVATGPESVQTIVRLEPRSGSNNIRNIATERGERS